MSHIDNIRRIKEIKKNIEGNEVHHIIGMYDGYLKALKETSKRWNEDNYESIKEVNEAIKEAEDD